MSGNSKPTSPATNAMAAPSVIFNAVAVAVIATDAAGKSHPPKRATAAKMSAASE
jgi:hypothetical protein